MGRSWDRGTNPGGKAANHYNPPQASALSENAISVTHSVQVDRVTTCNYSTFSECLAAREIALAKLA
jgi:hypothetical protein